MESARPIQILTPTNHEFTLELQNLKEIFEKADIKDRFIVAIAIAGAFRKGKSFLLNYFLRYLYAQYKKHDASDWVNELNTEFKGFSSQGGTERVTTGIWMWSEIFTHDCDNGDKLAIILLDTQGIFDDESTTKDYTATFAISTMMSSVQCYNVMQNVQEDDLQHLELFTEYGRLAMQQTDEKPFQNLLFIVRDWPYSQQHKFGNGKEFIDIKLAGNDKQSTEMKELRNRIRQSFEKIDAFLMPYPGSDVAEGRLTDVQQIDPRFIENVKELVPSLFAPGKLIVKKINGQKMRARDFITYLQAYVDVFNSDTLPEPKSVLMATADTSNQILYNECLKRYIDSMQCQIEQKSKDDFQPYFPKSDLWSIHDQAKATVLSQFQNTRKLGSSESIQTHLDKLESNIQMNFSKLDSENDKRKLDFDVMAEKSMQLLNGDCLQSYIDAMQNELNKTTTFLSFDALHQLHEKTKSESLSKFDQEKKFGGEELILDFKQKLETTIGNKYIDFEQENDKKKKQYEAIEEAKAKAIAAAAEAAAIAKAAAEAKARADAQALADAQAIADAIRAKAEADAKALADARAREEAERNISALKMENQQLQKAIKDSKKGGILRAVGAIGGIIAGGLFGGPGGAIAGAKMGEKVFDK